MELQLRLALPNKHIPVGKGFDLNEIGFKPNEDLGLNSCKENKRSFEDAFGKIGDESPVMPLLLLWSGQPNEEDDQKEQKKRNSSIINKNEEEKVLVGWPPVQTWRKKLLHQGQVVRIENNNRMADQKENNNGGLSNSQFVKVKMEGVPIARKVDLRLYHSFETLTNSLIAMFAKYHQIYEKPGVRYTLAYQDKQGDWLLAGDVPWLTFMGSVQRMKILRSCSEETG